MELSLFRKIGIVFEYMFSSILPIEMMILCLLLLGVLLANIKLKNKYINIAAIGIYLGFILGILISYKDYVILCVNGFVKSIMNFIYFPSTFAYFIEFIIITGMMLYTIFNKKIKTLERVVNYSCFTIMYFFFMMFIILTVTSGVDIYNTSLLYKNETILAVVQVSNLFLLCWVIFIGFYKLYQFYKKKFDKE